MLNKTSNANPINLEDIVSLLTVDGGDSITFVYDNFSWMDLKPNTLDDLDDRYLFVVGWCFMDSSNN